MMRPGGATRAISRGGAAAGWLRRPIVPRRVRPAAADRDRGSVALFMAVFTVGLLAMAGLVVDGGTALAARGRAHDVAQQAARAGADALSDASLRGASPTGLAIDPIQARINAQRYLRAGQATGTVTVTQDTVTVTAHITAKSTVLSAFGISDLSGDAEATATIVHGV